MPGNETTITTTPELRVTNTTESTTVTLLSQTPYTALCEYVVDTDPDTVLTVSITSASPTATISPNTCWVKAKFVDPDGIMSDGTYSRRYSAKVISGNTVSLSFVIPAYSNGLVVQYSSDPDFTSYTERTITTSTYALTDLSGITYIRGKLLGDGTHTSDSAWSNPIIRNFDSDAPVIVGVSIGEVVTIPLGDSVDLKGGITLSDTIDEAPEVHYIIFAGGNPVMEGDSMIDVDTSGLSLGSYTLAYYGEDSTGHQTTFVTKDLSIVAPRLSTPDPTITGCGGMRIRVVCEAVANATAYTLVVNDAPLTIDLSTGSAVIPVSERKSEYRVKLKAVGDDVNYSDSHWTDEVTLALKDVEGYGFKPVLVPTALVDSVQRKPGQLVVTDGGETYIDDNNGNRRAIVGMRYEVQ